MCLILQGRETVEYCTVEFESEVTLSQGRDDITQGGFRQVVALSVLNLYAEKGGYQLGVLVLVVIFPPIFGHCEKLTRGLREKRVGCVLVTDEEDKLIGVFTERDLLYRVAGQIQDLSGTSVGSVMTSEPTALRRSTPIAHALHLMSIHGFRHIPLVNRQGHPTGLTSFRRVVEFIGANFFSTPTAP